MTMRAYRPSFLAAVLVGLLAVDAQAEPRLLTIDEALQLSQTTGRPIFAVAGSKT